MPHIIILMLELIDALVGNATEGLLVNLRAEVVRVDALIPNMLDEKAAEAAHEELEEIQEFLSTAADGCGVKDRVEGFIAGLELYQ